MVFPVESYQAEINQIVSDVFSTMLRADVEPVAGAAAHLPSPTVTAAIFFAGNWKGAVLVECSVRQACRWTAHLTAVTPNDPPHSVNDDVRDAMGELVNMIGGNLKSVLPHGVGLSMPTLVEGNDYAVKLCGGNLVNRRQFRSEFEPFAVTLVEVVDG
jgi:chemotaxis protein CheX